MKTHRMQNAIALALGAAIVGLTLAASAAYDPNWKKSQCDTYSYHGLSERYVYGGDKGWIDNNVWDDPSTEGVDCSAYVPRCMALPSYIGEHTAGSHPYSTYTFYPGNVPNTFAVGASSIAAWDCWVYSSGNGGPGDHMGMVKSVDSSNVYTREARGTSYGVVSVTRSRQSLIDWNTRYYRRSNWGAESTAVTVDNNSGGFSVVGTWATGSSSTDKYGADYRYHSTAAVSEPATWAASVSGGTHSVYAWWPQGSNRSTTAPYIVYHGSTSTTVNKNQQSGGGSWQSLGSWGDFVSGNNQVKLSCWTATGYVVVADAVKWQ